MTLNRAFRKDHSFLPSLFIESRKHPRCRREVRKRRASERSTSFRNVLSFEHQAIPRTDERARRWSLHVPAASMNQEMLDMMLELHNLNSFFKDGLVEDVDQSVNPPGKEMEKPEPPSLVISNSYCAIPISLESSESIASGLPLSLAARRGKDQLPPLLLKPVKHNTLMTEYPSIPTAFLGSPSAYSPKFEYANAADDPSLDLEVMISSLRSQCASIHPDSQRMPQTENLLAKTSDLSVDSSTRSLESSDDEEWAFATSFMHKFDANATDNSFINKSYTSERQHYGPQEFNPVLSTGTPTWTPNLSIEPGHLEVIRSPPRGPPPSTPPPPLPSPSAQASPHKVRGILKNSKNVRFASLPDKSSKPSDSVETLLSRPRQSTALVPIDRPSRLRPKSNTIASSTPPLVLPRAHDTTPSHATRGVGRGTPGAGRPASVPISNHSDGFRTRRSGQPRTPLAFVSPQSVTPVREPSPRHSPGRAIKPDMDKEPNDTKASASSLSRRWTNENNFRRASDASQVTPKSRMPVPLRNILTRFK